MQNGLYVALSGQVSVERRLETIANNVANMNTVGFRADAVRFEEQVAKAGDNSLSYVSGGAEYVSRRTGPLTRTNNRLDLAIQGDGWFAIKQNGDTVYTRDGRFQLSADGSLTTSTARRSWMPAARRSSSIRTAANRRFPATA